MSESALVTVGIGACRCPGTPHPDGDSVSMDAELGQAAGIAAAAIAASDEEMSGAQRYGLIIEQAVQMSVRTWTLEHTNGSGRNERIPVTPETVREQLPWDKGGAEVAIEAMKLYGGSLGLPFGGRKSAPSSSSTPTGPTESPSTSPRSSTKRKRRARSA